MMAKAVVVGAHDEVVEQKVEMVGAVMTLRD